MSQTDKAEVESALVEHAKELLSQLETGNSLDAMQTIANLHQQRDQFLFDEIGKLTRSLHSAIQNFAIDAEVGQMDASEMSRMGDASDRLNYVIERTEEAANKTMDVVEEIMPISSGLSDEANTLHGEWARFMKKEMKPDEFRELTKKIDVFLTNTAERASGINSHLTTVLLAQDYQDLTGQVIKRVINLVQEVEDNLVSLVKMAGTVDHLTGTEHSLPKKEEVDALVGEGPIINPEQRDDVVTGQDDVDDLLSSLGF